MKPLVSAVHVRNFHACLASSALLTALADWLAHCRVFRSPVNVVQRSPISLLDPFAIGSLIVSIHRQLCTTCAQASTLRLPNLLGAPTYTSSVLPPPEFDPVPLLGASKGCGCGGSTRDTRRGTPRLCSGQVFPGIRRSVTMVANLCLPRIPARRGRSDGELATGRGRSQVSHVSVCSDPRRCLP